MNKCRKVLSIYFFGDSICFGQYISPCHTWVSKVAEALDDDLSPSGIIPIVQNPSVNGNTTRMALERMPHDIQSHNIDLLIIQFGINDSNYWRTDINQPRVSLDAFRSNIMEMIYRARANNIRKIILNTNHPTGLIEPFPGLDISHHQSNAKYNEIIRDVAEQQSEYVVLCDIENYLVNREVNFIDYLLPDMIHLNLNGHLLYFDAFYNVLFKQIYSIFGVTK